MSEAKIVREDSELLAHYLSKSSVLPGWTYLDILSTIVPVIREAGWDRARTVRQAAAPSATPDVCRCSRDINDGRRCILCHKLRVPVPGPPSDIPTTTTLRAEEPTFGAMVADVTRASGPDLRFHYGPTATDPDPGKMWHYDCGGEVWFLEDAHICRKCKMSDGDTEPVPGMGWCAVHWSYHRLVREGGVDVLRCPPASDAPPVYGGVGIGDPKDVADGDVGTDTVTTCRHCGKSPW